MKNIELIKHNAQKELSDKIKLYHVKYKQTQDELKNAFDINHIKKITINIWDDFYDDGFAPAGEVISTYAYVELEDIPDSFEKEILEELIKFISDNSLLPKEVFMEMEFHDSLTEYPLLVLEHEYCLYKRWQVKFTNISHKILDKLVKDLEQFKQIRNIDLDIISES